MAKIPTKPKLPPHVQLRGGVYQYYRRIPKDLADYPTWKGQVFIRRSLKTGDIRVAASEAAIIDGEVERAFRQARHELRMASQPRVIETMTVDEMDGFISRATGRLAAARAWDGYGGVIQRLPDATASSLLQWAQEQERVVVTETVRTQLEARLYQTTAPMPDRSQHGMFIESVRADVAPKHEPPPPPPTRTFDQLWEEYKADPSRTKRDYSSYTTVVAMMQEIVGGGRNVALITRDDTKRIRTALMTMPTYAKMPSRRPEYDGMTYEQIAADVKERLDDGDDTETIRPTVINKYLDALGRIFRFAVDEGYIQSSPAENLSVKASQLEDRRTPFSNDQLAVMFPAGFKPATDVDWMLTLALLHGCRGNELAQLEVTDVLKVGGVWSISISPFILDAEGNPIAGSAEKTKTIKSKSGIRIIPVHQLAVDLGFVEHVERRLAAGEGTVFGAKRWGKRGSSYDSIRGDIEEHLDRLGVRTAKTTFHSLRHNFRDACRDASIPTDYVREMGGWSRGGADAGYGKGTSPAVLKPYMDSIRYDIPIFKGR